MKLSQLVIEFIYLFSLDFCRLMVTVQMFDNQMRKDLIKAFQICESLSLATILVKEKFCLLTRLYQNTASESVVLDHM